MIQTVDVLSLVLRQQYLTEIGLKKAAGLVRPLASVVMMIEVD